MGAGSTPCTHVGSFLTACSYEGGTYNDSFTASVAQRKVAAYSVLYGKHPSLLVATKHGRFKTVSSSSDPYAGKSVAVMQARREKENDSDRMHTLNRIRSEQLKYNQAWRSVGTI